MSSTTDAQVLVNKDIKESEKIINTQRKVFYNTDDDSSISKHLRTLRCGCWNPKYVLTSESVRMEFCKGCSRVNDSIDIDKIEDMSLTQHLGLGYCCAGQGTIRIYSYETVNKKREEKVIKLVYIENAPKVFDEFASHVGKINNLVLGKARPDDPSTGGNLIYDSGADPASVKCLRSYLCCGCCFFPHTLITKSRITTIQWTPTCDKKTLQFDLDNVQQLTLDRPCISCLCHDVGTIKVQGTDKDQSHFNIRFVVNSKEVFTKLDSYVNLLNNRRRVLGEDMQR
jgi:hypothetical protein